MTDYRLVPDTPLRPLVRGSLIATLAVLLGGWLMLAGCASTDWGLADPDWTPPAESRAAGLVEPDIDPRHPGDTTTAGDVVAAPRALVEVTPGQVAAMESAVRRWIRAAPPGCFADPPPAPLALRDWRAWLARCHRAGSPPPAGAWPHSDLFRHWSNWSRSGQWHWQTITPRLTDAFSRSAFASWCGPDPNRPSRDRCDARALYSEADVQRALGGNPGPGPGPVDPPPPANPCPGWEPWPPPEGADSCVSWTAPDFPPECGYSPPGPFDRGPVCNGRFRDSGEPPPPPGPVCGDGTCSEGETQATCPVDCGTAPPPPPPPSGDCDLSPVVQRQDALIAELERLREALADRPPLVCPEPVCHPAPCRLDCDCPAPCPDVDCGDGGPEPPVDPPPTDPPTTAVEITADFLANNHKRTTEVPWSAAQAHVRVDANASSRVDQQPSYPISPAQVVFGCLRPAPDPRKGKGLCIIRQPDKRGARLDNGQNVSCGSEGGWQIDHRDGTISERCGLSLTYQVTLAVVDDLAVDLSLDPKFETDGAGNPTAWFVPRSGNIRFRLTPVAQQRRGLEETEVFELPYALWGVRWGEGVGP